MSSASDFYPFMEHVDDGESLTSYILLKFDLKWYNMTKYRALCCGNLTSYVNIFLFNRFFKVCYYFFLSNISCTKKDNIIKACELSVTTMNMRGVCATVSLTFEFCPVVKKCGRVRVPKIKIAPVSYGREGEKQEEALLYSELQRFVNLIFDNFRNINVNEIDNVNCIVYGYLDDYRALISARFITHLVRIYIAFDKVHTLMSVPWF